MKKYLQLFSLLIVLLVALNVNAQWTQVGTVPLSGTWPSISVSSSDVCWIVGGASTPMIFRTVNGGINWYTVPVNGLQVKALMCVWASDSLTAFVGDGGDASGSTGGDAIASKTTNGGQNWIQMFNTGGTAGFFNGIVFSKVNPLWGIAESDPPTGGAYYIQKTVDGGNTWFLQNPQASGSASAQNSIVIIDTNLYGFGLNSTPNRIGLTTNAGVNWSFIPLTGGGTSGFIAGFTFSTDKLNGLASASTASTTLARTTNGGTTWFSQTIPSSVTSAYPNIKWVPGLPVAYCIMSSASSTACVKTTNNGATWTAMTFPAGTGQVNHFEIVLEGNTVYGYCVKATGGVVYKMVDVLVGINDPNTNIPSEFKLEQNYPNPFNPVTKIDYSLPISAFVTINVYDALGRNVSALVSQQKSAGNHFVEFDASNLSSGVYYYTINAGNFVQTKKMMLVK